MTDLLETHWRWSVMPGFAISSTACILIVVTDSTAYTMNRSSYVKFGCTFSHCSTSQASPFNPKVAAYASQWHYTFSGVDKTAVLTKQLKCYSWHHVLLMQYVLGNGWVTNYDCGLHKIRQCTRLSITIINIPLLYILNVEKTWSCNSTCILYMYIPAR